MCPINSNEDQIVFIIFYLSDSFIVSIFKRGEPKTDKKNQHQEYLYSEGFFFQRNIPGTLTDFRKLAPQSILLSNDFSSYSQSLGLQLKGNAIFSAMLGFQFSNSEKTMHKANPVLRLGISIFSGTSLTSTFSHEERKRIDTLTSGQTGEMLYVDSVTTKRYAMEYGSVQVRLDGSVIFRTDPEARWSLFGGLGFTTGLSIYANTEISYSQSSRSVMYDLNGHNRTLYYYSGADDSKTESHTNKNNVGFSGYIPAGLDFRIGRKNKFWKHAHVFLELRPGINFTSIPELRTIANKSMQAVLGLRIALE